MANGPLPFDSTTHPKVLLEDDWNNLLAQLEKTAAFVIRKNNTYYEAISGGTSSGAGQIAYGGADNLGATTGTDCHSVVTNAITGADGKLIFVKEGLFGLTDEITVGKANTNVIGSGKATKFTQATANKNVFSITTMTDVRLSNMWLYGTGAGTGSGVYATTGCTNLALDRIISENHGYYGAHIINTNYPVLSYNRFDSNIYNGLLLDTVDFGRVLNTKMQNNTRHGAALVDCNSNLIEDNIIIGNDSADSTTYDGVNLSVSGATTYYNSITNNVIRANDRYEIGIGASCLRNLVVPNTWVSGDDHVRIIQDDGTDTILHTLNMPFTNGTTHLSTAGAAWGYEIDANLEYALATGVLPANCHQVVRWKIYANSIVAEADQMLLEIVGQGGGDRQAFDHETVNETGVQSVTANFGADSYMYWMLDASDDTDIDDFVGGEHLQIKVLHEAAAGADSETDAVFENIKIEYV